MADNINNNDNIKDLSEALQFLPSELSGLSAATKDADLPGLTKAIDNARAPELTKALKDLSSSISNESLLKRTIEANTRALNSLTSKIDQLIIQQAQRPQQGVITTGQQVVQQNNPQLDKIIQLLTALSTNQVTDRAQRQAEGGEANKSTGFLASLGLFVKGMWLTNKKLEERGLSGNEWARLGHHVGNKMSGGAKTFVGGGLDMMAAGSIAGGAMFMGIGFIADQIMKAVSDHILSIPKSWATTNQGRVLTGNYNWSELKANNGGLIDNVVSGGGWQDFTRLHGNYRFRAGRMGYANDEFYNRYLDFVGAGVRGPSGGALSAVDQYLMPALAMEKATGGQVKFTTEFLAAINKSTSSTYSLEKHIQVLDATVRRNVYVSEKQLQTFTNAIASSVRGNVGNGNDQYAKSIAMFAPLMNSNLVTEQEASGILLSSKGLSFDQRARIAAFVPELGGSGVVGGAQRFLENTATAEGLNQNLEYYKSLVRTFTGGRAFMSLDDNERGLVTQQLHQFLPSQLVGSSVFGKIIDGLMSKQETKEAIEDALKSPEIKQLEEVARGIATLEDPLKQIRDYVVGALIHGIEFFLGKPNAETVYKKDFYKYTGLTEDKQILSFTNIEYERATREEQAALRAAVERYEQDKAKNTDGYKQRSFDELYRESQQANTDAILTLNGTMNTLNNTMSNKQKQVTTSSVAGVDTTASDPLGI